MGYHIKLNEMQKASVALVELPGTYAYSKRVPVQSVPYEELLHRIQSVDDNNGVLKKLCSKLKQECEELQEHQTWTYGDTRYLVDEIGSSYDRFGTIELLGGMQYSKPIQLAYVLYDTLDYALSYVFRTPIEQIRENLLSNCRKYGIDYFSLSYAFSSGDKNVLNGFDLGCFKGISELLDKRIEQLLDNKYCQIYQVGPSTLDLRLPQYNAASRVTQFILAKIRCFNTFVFNSILDLFSRAEYPFITSAACVPVSVGTAAMVIAAKSDCLPTLEIDIPDAGVLVLPVLTYRNIGGYNENNWYNHSGC